MNSVLMQGGAPTAGFDPMDVIVVILTFNSAELIERTVSAAKRVSSNIFVVDSYSTDGTPERLRALGCEVVQRPFKHYADQRNWAIEVVSPRASWQLHLDADEVLDDAAITEISTVLAAPGTFDGFIFERMTYFMGRPLRFGGANNWHLRLFRTGSTRCEDRLYDQHFKCSGATRVIRGRLHDLNVGTLTEWVQRHNRWSSLEAEELLRQDDSDGRIAARLSVDPRERRRLYKGAYYRAPVLLRPMMLFLMRYLLQLGFLDGRAGFLYAFLQTFWFRMLVDAKLIERQSAQAEQQHGKALGPA